MGVDHIRYDLLTQQALRAVVRRVISDVAKTGTLPGEHHFYVTFATQAQGVRISPRLREQYPEEMTIVLQHQFWDLVVSESHFEVALSFNGISEKLYVPLDAIKGFFDPSVQFGLQFETLAEAAKESAAEETGKTAKPKRKTVLQETGEAPPAIGPAKTAGAETARAELARTEPAKPEPKAAVAETADKPEPDKPEPDKPSSGAEVVRLDRFRKK